MKLRPPIMSFVSSASRHCKIFLNCFLMFIYLHSGDFSLLCFLNDVLLFFSLSHTYFFRIVKLHITLFESKSFLERIFEDLFEKKFLTRFSQGKTFHCRVLVSQNIRSQHSCQEKHSLARLLQEKTRLL